MKQVCAIFVCLFAIACAAENNCDFTCLSEKEVSYFSLTLKCEGTTICNRKCQQSTAGPEEYPKCIEVQEVCPYSCEGEKIIIGSMPTAMSCPDNKKCNTALDSCENMCKSEDCPNKDMYTCVDDYTADIFGILYKCPNNTVCNKKYAQPCAICMEASGALSPIKSWLTKPH